MSQIINIEQLCEACAPVYRAMGYPAPTGKDVINMLVEEERQRVAQLNAGLKRESTRKHERTFLRDEKGKAYGEVKAEIPADLYYHLRDARNTSFGPDTFKSKEGVREVLKAFPQCGVKNVGMKTHGHTRHARKNFNGINWGRNTIQFAS